MRACVCACVCANLFACVLLPIAMHACADLPDKDINGNRTREKSFPKVHCLVVSKAYYTPPPPFS